MLGRNCYHQTSATLISDKMDLILKFFALGAMVDCLDTSQEESFHISLPYINIITYFFEKIKKDFLISYGCSSNSINTAVRHHTSDFQIHCMMYLLSCHRKNGDRVGFETNIIHRSFTLTKNYFSDLIPPRTTVVVFLKRPTI